MKPVRKISLHEVVVDQIRRSIHLGDYLPGDMLPPERDIADRLNVSRETVREAIGVLEIEGYVVSRRGATGGHAVTALTEPVARTLTQLQSDKKSIIHLMEFRRANECLAARLAAERSTASDLKRIGRAVEDLKTAGDIPQFRRADASFHRAVANAARNPYVERAILDARAAIFLLHGNRDYKIVLETTLSGHRDIFEAIRARDPDAAEKAMARHIDIALKEIQHTLRSLARARR